MNRLEDRLRDAFGAAADTVRPESVARLADPTRAVRARRLAPLMAAAAVALIVIAITVAVPLALSRGHGAPSRPAGPAAPSPFPPASSATARPVTIPDTVGMPEGQAIAILQGMGLQVAIIAQASSVAPVGCVIAQTPAPGTRALSGATIMLTVAAADGSPPATAP